MNIPPIVIPDNILELKVPFKKPEPEDKLLVIPWSKCIHGPFEVDDQLSEVTCKKCNAKLNPMYVLKTLAHDETRWHESFKRYNEQMKRLTERSRTKCQHCEKMTRISHA